MRDYIDKILSRRNLTHEEITVVMELIMAGHVPAEEIRDFLLALNANWANAV